MLPALCACVRLVKRFVYLGIRKSEILMPYFGMLLSEKAGHFKLWPPSTTATRRGGLMSTTTGPAVPVPGLLVGILLAFMGAKLGTRLRVLGRCT